MFSNLFSNKKTDPNKLYLAKDFITYLQSIVHRWLRVLAMLGATLIPIFLVLDYFTMPQDLLLKFTIYRSITTFIVILQFLIIRFTKPNRFYYLHGYFFSFIVGGMIVIMTFDLGGFNSSYYAGLILVMIAVNMLLSWKPIHSLLNGGIIVGTYIIINSLNDNSFETGILINNLFFLISTVVITTSISWVRYNLVKTEYDLRSELYSTNTHLDQSRAELVKVRDKLWGEMQVAKMIQTALLPEVTKIGNYEIAAMMLPADEVGGDYYDIIENQFGEFWIGMGDVSGHGVDSGLIMMMAQTSIQTIVTQNSNNVPSEVLAIVNKVIRENIARLKSEKYMTMVLLKIMQDSLIFSGKHTDILIYRDSKKKVESIETEGSWLGVANNLEDVLENKIISIGKGDIILLFTDGVTEATNSNGEMFGEERLISLLEKNAGQSVNKLSLLIFSTIIEFDKSKKDDFSIVIIKNI